MKQNLLDVFTKINCNDYTLKEIAYFFETYNGYVLKVETTNYSIKTKIDKYTLPHILGLHYAFGDKKDSKKYKGKLGFEKLKSGKITLAGLRNIIKNKPNIKIGWKMVERRIEYLPMFLNTIERRTRFRVISNENIARNTSLKGKYALFKIAIEAGKDIFPMMSLKEINNNKIVVETFIIEDNISFLGGLQEEKIDKIELIAPIDARLPKISIKEKETINS